MESIRQEDGTVYVACIPGLSAIYETEIEPASLNSVLIVLLTAIREADDESGAAVRLARITCAAVLGKP